MAGPHVPKPAAGPAVYSRVIKRWANKGTVANAMLIFVPLALLGTLYGFGAIFVFTCSALSCVALSYRLGQATESLGSRFGPVSGGLLNATFGNAAELIISIVALSHGLFLVVRITLIGSILGQLLLVLGTSLLLGGFKHKELGFSRQLVQINFTLMAIALVAIGLPSVMLMLAPERAHATASYLAPTLCVLLLIIYGLAVTFSLGRQPEESNEGGGPNWSVLKGFPGTGGLNGRHRTDL